MPEQPVAPKTLSSPSTTQATSASYATLQVGDRVFASDGPVGSIERLIADPATGETVAIAVRDDRGELVEVPVSLVDISSGADGEVRLLVARGSLSGGVTALPEVGDRLVVAVHEEVLTPTFEPVQIGQVRIHKRVEEVVSTGHVERYRDDVSIERIAIGRPIDAVPAPRNEGDTLVIPVIEEILVTEKRLVLKEEIRVTRRRVTEQVPVEGTVRREVVDIEEATTPNNASLPER